MSKGIDYSVEPRIYMEETDVDDANLTCERYHRHITYTDIAASRTLALPPVEEMVGTVISIVVTGWTSDELTISPHSDDKVDENILDVSNVAASSHSSSWVLNEADEYVILLSVGLYWVVLSTKVA